MVPQLITQNTLWCRLSYTLTGNITGLLGTAPISGDSLSYLSDGNTTSGGLVVSPGESVELVFDLYNRYFVFDIYYYFTGPSTVLVYLEESHGVWAQVYPTVYSWGLYLRVENTQPKRVKFTHLATSVSSTIHELQVYNDGTLIGFDFPIVALDSLGETIPVVVNNNSGEYKDLNIFIGLGDGADSISVSSSVSGPFYERYSKGLIVPSVFDWMAGRHVGTTVSGTWLTLSGVSVSGTYYSPVVDVYDYDNYRVFLDEYKPAGSFIGYLSNNSEDCIGVRSYYLPPSGWSSGQLASDSDYYWGIVGGVLNFSPAAKETIIADKINRYVQLCITITGAITNKPYISKMGFETPVVVSGIEPHGSANIYVHSDGSTAGNTTSLITWYKGN